MATVDSSMCSSRSYSATSAADTVMTGPCSSGPRGWSRRITTADVILVRDATGTDDSGPDWAV